LSDASEARFYDGLTFETLRLALTAIYWHDPEAPEEEASEWLKNIKYVVPMQHNWNNPISAEDNDTYIQYWIDSDDRLTQDYYGVDQTEETLKVAEITLRFMGARAEQWAKAFHHLSKRPRVSQIFRDFCNGETFEYISPIRPMNVDYFKSGDTVIGHDVSFSLKYTEYMDLSGLRGPLEYISLSAGTVKLGG
jgi:hypothetical protein